MVEAIGIVRRVDALGRVVLPVEWRRHLQIDPDTLVELLAQGQQIIVRKYVPGCLICGNRQPQGHSRVCSTCLQGLIAGARDEGDGST